MNVAVLCEWSGRVRNAFIRRGHAAVSCDLEPSASPGPHVQGDLMDYDWSAYDMVIAFPPCTHLAVSGARYFAEKRADGRQQAAIDFVMNIANLPVERIAIENPVGVLSTVWRKPDQIIQPWQFGHPESKTTCLWLKGLPPLIRTNVLPVPKSGRWANQTPSGQNKLGPSPERAKLRGATYRGIADAMAEQWGALP